MEQDTQTYSDAAEAVQAWRNKAYNIHRQVITRLDGWDVSSWSEIAARARKLITEIVDGVTDGRLYVTPEDWQEAYLIRDDLQAVEEYCRAQA